ncbi:hypothetical protein M405DRAFT_809195 [Rhizopogon salebrosus TDB-379]|nr:hypothetical protein M405DRAFT_809195 [Rhizopogon salebrosus TDB-379]
MVESSKRIPPSPDPHVTPPFGEHIVFLTIVCRLVLALLSSHFPWRSHGIPIMFRLSSFIISDVFFY